MLFKKKTHHHHTAMSSAFNKRQKSMRKEHRERAQPLKVRVLPNFGELGASRAFGLEEGEAVFLGQVARAHPFLVCV